MKQKSHASSVIALIYHNAQNRKTNLMHTALCATDLLQDVSMRATSYRWDSSLTSSSAQRKQIGWKCTMFVISWHVAYFSSLLPCPYLKHQRHRPQQWTEKCSSAAPLRACTGLYLDKQIDKQSTLFHYRAEKVNHQLEQRSTAAAESWGGRGGTKQYEFQIHLRANTYTGILLIEDALGGNY